MLGELARRQRGQLQSLDSTIHGEAASCGDNILPTSLELRRGEKEFLQPQGDDEDDGDEAYKQATR
jgi:hypothetical protein